MRVEEKVRALGGFSWGCPGLLVGTHADGSPWGGRAEMPGRPSPLHEKLGERFWSKVDATAGSGGCWPWTAGLFSAGYGAFQFEGRVQSAHRLAYMALVGPIPDGLHIDHLCRNRACVNPAHLEPVTQRENTLRGVSIVAVNARKTHCIRGHEFTPENTALLKTGGRRCRRCHALRYGNEEARASLRTTASRDNETREVPSCEEA